MANCLRPPRFGQAAPQVAELNALDDIPAYPKVPRHAADGHVMRKVQGERFERLGVAAPWVGEVDSDPAGRSAVLATDAGMGNTMNKSLGPMGSVRNCRSTISWGRTSRYPRAGTKEHCGVDEGKVDRALAVFGGDALGPAHPELGQQEVGGHGGRLPWSLSARLQNTPTRPPSFKSQ